jgi:hypothetical protein
MLAPSPPRGRATVSSWRKQPTPRLVEKSYRPVTALSIKKRHRWRLSRWRSPSLSAGANESFPGASHATCGERGPFTRLAAAPWRVARGHAVRPTHAACETKTPGRNHPLPGVDCLRVRSPLRRSGPRRALQLRLGPARLAGRHDGVLPTAVVGRGGRAEGAALWNARVQQRGRP